MNNDRPILTLHKTKADILLEQMALAVLIILWIYVIASYRSLPEIIPAHYDFQGRADRYDHKILIFLVPAITTVIFFGLRLINKYPNKFNYISTITKENAEKQYAFSTRLLRIISLVIVLTCSYLEAKVIHDSKEPVSLFDWWFLPFFFLGLMAPTVYYIWRSMKMK